MRQQSSQRQCHRRDDFQLPNPTHYDYAHNYLSLARVWVRHSSTSPQTPRSDGRRRRRARATGAAATRDSLPPPACLMPWIPASPQRAFPALVADPPRGTSRSFASKRCGTLCPTPSSPAGGRTAVPTPPMACQCEEQARWQRSGGWARRGPLPQRTPPRRAGPPRFASGPGSAPQRRTLWLFLICGRGHRAVEPPAPPTRCEGGAASP